MMPAAVAAFPTATTSALLYACLLASPISRMTIFWLLKFTAAPS